VAALAGISEGDADKLKAAFGIDTVEELGRHKLFVSRRRSSIWPIGARSSPKRLFDARDGTQTSTTRPRVRAQQGVSAGGVAPPGTRQWRLA
jgi:hypothetical protein